WTVNVQPYLKSSQMWQCPSEPNPPGGAFLTTDYGYNFTFGANSNNGLSQVLSVGAQTQLSLTVMVCDSTSYDSNSWEDGCKWWLNGDANGCPVGAKLAVLRAQITNTAQVPKPEANPMQRHLGGWNYAFADGHVKWYKA